MRNNALLFREILYFFLKLWVEKYNNGKKPRKHAQSYNRKKTPNNGERKKTKPKKHHQKKKNKTNIAFKTG